MKMLFISLAAAAAALLSGCETSTYGEPSFGGGAELRDSTNPTGTITDSQFMQ